MDHLSEREPQPELQLAHFTRSCDLTERRCSQGRIRAVQADQVEYVSELATHLEFHPFPKTEVPENPHVDIADSGAVEKVARRITIRAERTGHESRGVKPLVDHLSARAVRIQIGVADDIRAIVRNAIEVI